MTRGTMVSWVTVLAGFLLIAPATLAHAASAGVVPGSRFDEGSQMCRELNFFNSSWVSEGAALFKKTCKACHYRGNDKGARFLYSESFTPRAWNRIFAEKSPKCAQDGSWSGLDPEQLRKVNDYLYRNGYGTYDPNSAESCG